jgi:transposase
MTTLLQENQWLKIVTFLRDCPGVYVGDEAQCRRFVEGVLWITRTGAQWRFLPKEYGRWNSVYKRFARWCDKGIWEEMFEHFVDDPDMENLIIDSTVIRAHPCAAGAPKQKGGQPAQALGRSRGGFSTKIHIGVDALGNPLRFILTAGQRHDITQGSALIADLHFDRIIADRSYDANDFLQAIGDVEAEAVIPPQSRRREQRSYDKHLYKERHLVECFVNKIKHYRRIFSRFEKLAARYLSFLCLVGTLIWLR